jgi:hypothetical protein
MIEQEDEFTGRWRLNAQISNLTTPPQIWLQQVFSTPETISVQEEIITRDGTVAVSRVQAKFDGKDYQVEGSPLIETIAYRRTDRRTILGTGRKRGAIVLTETVTVDPTARRLSLDYRLYNGDHVVAFGLACFEREA